MKLTGKYPINFSQIGWVILGCVLFPLSSFGALFPVEQTSSPAGLVSASAIIEQGNSYQSIDPQLNKNGYTFGYWAIDGVRQAGADGRALTRVTSVINANSTYTAHYFGDNEDTDGDGVKDWFEYRMFGDLSKSPSDDSDGDGFSNKRESELGQDALIVDFMEPGGIAGRMSNTITYADTSMLKVTIKSNPTGFISTSITNKEVNASVATQSLNGATNGSHFAYWTINGVRQASPNGVASSKVSLNISGTTEIVAHYVPSNEDSDGDGVKDWFELYQFGDLASGPSDDSDGDGFSNKREGELGQEATIAEFTEPGGIAGRMSNSFSYADTSMVLVTIKSNPAGFIAESITYREYNSTVTTQNLNGPTNGSHFAYWTIDGVRQYGPTGVSQSKVSDVITADTLFTAHYIPSNEDTDGDGVKDWFEMYQFGSLSLGPEDDPDGDGFSNKREGELGQEATIGEFVEAGGIAGRMSNSLVYYVQLNRPPDGLDLNRSFVFMNKDANRTVGGFSPSDPDDPGLMRSYDYQLRTGPGGTDNHRFNLVGNLLRTSQTFTSEGNFSILVRVTDDENASYDKNFTIVTIDPLRDDDGDGLGYEQELLLGTGINVFDSDGDGASDGSEISAGTDPLDPNVFPNRPPVDLNSTAPLVIYENAPVGTLVGEFNATELDGDPMSFALSQHSSYPHNHYFTLEANGTLRTSAEFDYENNVSVFQIMVRTVDDQNASTEKLFPVHLLNVNENPHFTSISLISLNHNLIQEISIPEGLSYALEINATDVDGDALTYEKISSVDFSLFDLNTSDGRLFFKTIPDFEVPHDSDGNNTYEIWFRAHDGNGGYAEKRLTIRIINVVEDLDGDGVEDHYDPDDDGDGFSDLEELNYPSDPRDANSVANVAPDTLDLNGTSILENQPVGTRVGQLLASDPDANASLHFALVEGNHSAGNIYFSIDQNGSLITTVSFDYENNESNFSVRVQVADEHNFSIEKTFTIHLLNQNELPYDLTDPSMLRIQENQPAGTRVGDIVFADPDQGSVLDYALVSGAFDNQSFTLDANGTIRSARTFDYELNSTHTIKIRVTDENNASVENDYSIAVINVVEDLDGDGVEDHYDPDDDGDGFTDLDELNYPSDPRDANSVANVAPDSLDLNVTSILENQPVGTRVGQFYATDADANTTFHFTLVDGNNSGGNIYFSIDQNGSLITAVDFDYETNESEYSIHVRVADEHNFSLEKTFVLSLVNVVEDPDGDGIENHYDFDDDGDGFSDEEEIAYGSDPLDPLSISNTAPTELSITNSVIRENAPARSVVGQLVGYDPNPGTILQYSLVDGNGSLGNVYFEVAENGILLTTASLDFEKDGSSLSIRVKASDEKNASLEAVFAISVIDEFRPIVRTGKSVFQGDGTVKISGDILDTGGLYGITERGFLVSSYAEPSFDQNHTTQHPADINSSGGFEILFDRLESGKRYHYRAYAINAEGVSYGASQSFETPDSQLMPKWSTASPVQGADNWWQSPWFGSFFMGDDNGWIMHEKLGWLFVLPQEDSVWLWQDKLGWLWTAADIYPYLYRDEEDGWIFFHGGRAELLLFFSFEETRWIQISRQ